MRSQKGWQHQNAGLPLGDSYSGQNLLSVFNCSRALFPGSLILFQESGVDWHCFLRLQACVLSVLSLQSLPHGAHGAGCPSCAHIGKGVTLLLTLANPGRHVKGQQSVMFTCSMADGTWDWLSPSHPSGLTYKTGKELFHVPLHAPDRVAEELSCLLHVLSHPHS